MSLFDKKAEDLTVKESIIAGATYTAVVCGAFVAVPALVIAGGEIYDRIKIWRLKHKK